MAQKSKKKKVFLFFLFSQLALSIATSAQSFNTKLRKSKENNTSDTVYIHDTVFIKDDRDMRQNKKAVKPIQSDQTNYVDYRALVDYLFYSNIEFNRDSLAALILKNDTVFNQDWSTGQVYYSKRSLASLPKEIELFLIKGNEIFFYNWFGAFNSPYGPRWGRMHKGIDTHLKTGDTLRSSFNGIVRYAQFNEGGYGNCVVVRHFNGLETLYAHQSKLVAKAGDLVKTGDLIGLGGTTGRSDGPHLHFETSYKSYTFDPMAYLLVATTMVLKSDTVFVKKSDMYDSNSPSAIVKGSSTPAKKGKGTSYKVKAGDTLSSIAKKNKTTVSQLKKINKMKSDVLQIGRVIKIR